MPALFALGIAPALEAVQAEMLPDERVRAFLDDVYVTSHPRRVAHLLDKLQHHVFVQAHIRLNPSKTRVWNAAGVQPRTALGRRPWPPRLRTWLAHPRHSFGHS